MPWSLVQAYDAYPQIEEEFSAALDQSLDPRGPDLLYDVVARLRLAAGAVVLDVGSGEGRQAMTLHQRFGFRVTGIDPVPRHVEAARALAGQDGPVFEVGAAENIPVGSGTADLVWCRDVLVHVADLPRAYAEFRRVLRPGGHAIVYQMFGSELLEPREAAWLWAAMGVVPDSADPARAEAAIAAAGLRIDERLEIGSEWSEWVEEHHHSASRKLLHASRLQRNWASYLERYGQAACDMMLGDCLWHVYAMIGKLTRRVYLLSSDHDREQFGP